MKVISRFLSLLLFAATLALLATLSLHVVRNGSKVKVVAKEHLTLIETYEDVTNWTTDDAIRHPAFVARVIDAGQKDILPSAVTDKTPLASNPSH